MSKPREITNIILSELRNVETCVKTAGSHIHQLKQWFEDQQSDKPRFAAPTAQQVLELLQKAQDELNKVTT